MGDLPSAIARVTTLVAVIAVASACTNKSTSPNTTPGQCVLQDHVWYCGGAYGNIPACQGNESCDNDAAACFNCSNDPAGTACSCTEGQDGGRSWQCEPTGTGCQCPLGQSCN